MNFLPQNLANICSQFDLTGYQLCPYPMDSNWRNIVPKFTANNAISAKDHIRSFNAFVQEIGMDWEDIRMRLFMMSLTEDARDWFNSLPNDSISLITDFHNQFKEQYGN